MKEKIKGLGRQFISFGLIGGFNTLLSLIIYWVCIRIGIHYLIANTIGFIITVSLSYVLNNLFTFRKEGNKTEWSVRTLFKVYASYFFTGIIINGILLWFWNDIVGINENLSPVLNLFITIPLNFVLNKIWAYGKTNRDKSIYVQKETEKLK